MLIHPSHNTRLDGPLTEEKQEFVSYVMWVHESGQNRMWWEDLLLLRQTDDILALYGTATTWGKHALP
jgi:hypothetical protein